MVVIGVANPTSIREVLGSFDIRIDTGIRMQKAEVIPWSMTGMLLPLPLKYPMLLNRMQVRIQSAENPFRYRALWVMTSGSLVKKEDITPPPKNPAIKMKIPTVQPVIIAVKNPFFARSTFPAPIFCATNAETVCITEDGTSMMKATIFCATPYPADGIRPIWLTMVFMTRNEI